MSASHGQKENVYNSARSAYKKLKASLYSFFCLLWSSKKTLLLVAIVAIVSIVGTSLFSTRLSESHNVYLPSLGTIKTIDVELYWDSGGKNQVEALDWGEIEPGDSFDTTVYVRSASNVEVSLTLNLTDWSPPSISDYITLSWDYNGTRLSPSEIIPVTISLTTTSSDAFIDYLVENEVSRFEVAIHFVGVD